jgi:hypothetical protein
VTANGYTGNPPGGGGGGGSVAWADITGKPSTFTPSAHTQAASTISDSTTVGRAVLTAVDAAAGRTALGAGTSSLTLGSTGSTAAAGNHGHAQADVTNLVTDLAGKAPSSHTHVSSAVTDLVETVQDTVGAMVVAGSNVTATYNDGAGTLTIAASGGGGGSTVVKRGYVTSGDITLPNTASAWQALTGGPTVVIPAAVGDYVEFNVMGMRALGASSFLDPAVIVSGSPVRYSSTGGGTPALEGNPETYPNPGEFLGMSTIFEFVAQAGDISGGNITLGFGVKANGTGTLYASASYPLRLRAINYGAVSVS